MRDMDDGGSTRDRSSDLATEIAKNLATVGIYRTDSEADSTATTLEVDVAGDAYLVAVSRAPRAPQD